MNEQEIYDWMVCARCFTYNHAPYIVNTMNGFTMQETTFPFVCCIVDDASTDGEQEIIKNYLKEYFDLEDKTIVRHEENDDYALTYAQHKANKNCYFAVLALKYNHYGTKQLKARKFEYISEWFDNSKYHALCEGDDYWTAPQKLQKQVDFLDEHKDYSLCFTDKLILGGDKKYHDAKSDKYLRNVSDFRPVVIDGGYIHTATILYRRSMYVKMPKAFDNHKWLMRDFQMCIELLHEGKINYWPEITAVYRRLDNSACHFNSIEKALAFQESAYSARSYYCNFYFDMQEFQTWADNYYCAMGLTISCRFHNWKYIKKYLSYAKKKGLLNFSLIKRNMYVYIIEYPVMVGIRKFLTTYFFKNRNGLQEV